MQRRAACSPAAAIARANITMPHQGWREKQLLAITLLLLHTLIIQRMKPAFAFTLWISEIVLVYPGDLPEFQAPLALESVRKMGSRHRICSEAKQRATGA